MKTILGIATIIIALSLIGCSQQQSAQNNQTNREISTESKPAGDVSSATDKVPAANDKPVSVTKKASGLIIEDMTLGTGTEVKAGHRVSVHYTGWLKDGKVFDSSLKRNEPFSFVVGSGNVIKGWEEGILGMKVGGKRKLTIPYQLGYGEAGSGTDIPPKATLFFEIELLSID